MKSKVVLGAVSLLLLGAALVSVPAALFAQEDGGWFDYGVTEASFPSVDLGGSGDLGGSVKDGGWIDYGVTQNDIPWNDYGVTQNQIPWNDYGITQNQTPWTDYGVTGPSTNYAWNDYGVTGPAVNYGWTDYGVTSGATGWTDYGVTGPQYVNSTAPVYNNYNTNYASASAQSYAQAQAQAQAPVRVSAPQQQTIMPARTSATSYASAQSYAQAPVYIAQPQRPVVYQQPQYPQVPAPTCQIYQAQASGYNSNSAYLSWTTYGASNATLSGFGQVSTPTGNRSVYASGTYTLTVYNSYGQSGHCSVVVNLNTYYPTPTPTPIPYPIPTPAPQPYPVPTPIPQGNTYCTITASPSNITNGQASYLSWTSYGANTAWLSDGLGVVALSGSLAVRPEASRTYTLTVSGYNGTRTCNVAVNVSGRAAHVSLTQIPYTGFDYGTMGNMIYWLSLMGFAVAAAYLTVYNMPKVAFSMPSVTLPRISLPKVSMPTITLPKVSLPKMPVHRQQSAVSGQIQPAATLRTTDHELRTVSAPAFLPVQQSTPARATKDSMSFAHSKAGEAPRIVISRS